MMLDDAKADGGRSDGDLAAMKRKLRAQMRAWRRGLPGLDARGRRIWERVRGLDVYHRADTVMCYVALGDEVPTQPEFPRLWSEGKRLVVPYCVGDRLGLFHLQTEEELAPGTLKILEPREHLRTLRERAVPPHEIDLILVPGLAFDQQGNRLGQGGGYYDRLLRQEEVRAATIGLAFDCQIIDRVPSAQHDVPVEVVVTESSVYGVGH